MKHELLMEPPERLLKHMWRFWDQLRQNDDVTHEVRRA